MTKTDPKYGATTIHLVSGETRTSEDDFARVDARKSNKKLRDEWNSALDQFWNASKHRKSDPKPLAQLMRKSKVVPEFVLKRLADLIDPPLNWEEHPTIRLTFEVSKRYEEFFSAKDSLSHKIAWEMLSLRNSGIKHEDARESVAEQFGRSSRWVEKVFADYCKRTFPPQLIKHVRRIGSVLEQPARSVKRSLAKETSPKKAERKPRDSR